jgi:hypothetical protein
MDKQDLERALSSVFVSPNEADRNMEPANVVDGLYAVAGAIRSASTDLLTNRWFHSRKDGKINWQGRILGKVREGRYLVQLYSWLDGGPTNQKIVAVEEMDDWDFYDSDKDMNWAYEKSGQ